MTHNGSRGTTRRRMLLGLGAGAVVGLAGCMGGSASGADDVPVRGDPDADVVLEVYEDMNCPACRSYVQNGFDDIRSGYLDDGLIRYEHRDFIVTDPPDSVGPAEQAANAAREVLDRNGNDAFWEFFHAIYDNQNRLQAEAPAVFGDIAADLGYDGDAVETAGREREHQSAVDADMDRGESLGIRGTPSFVLDGNLLDMGGAATMSQVVATLSGELDQALSG